MKEDKNLIVTITQGGKPAFATECKLFVGVSLLDDSGNANALMLGHATTLEVAAVVASLYDLIESIEDRCGPELKKLVKLARKIGVRRND